MDSVSAIGSRRSWRARRSITCIARRARNDKRFNAKTQGAPRVPLRKRSASHRHTDDFADAERQRGGDQPEKQLATAGIEYAASGHQCDQRADAEQRQPADDHADDDRRRAIEQGKRRDWEDCADGEQEERSDPCFPGGAAQFLRVDAEFFA